MVVMSQVCKLFSDYLTRRKDDQSLRRVLVATCRAANLARRDNDTFTDREFSAYGDLLKQAIAFVFSDAKFPVRATTCRALLLTYARSNICFFRGFSECRDVNNLFGAKPLPENIKLCMFSCRGSII